MAKPRGMLLGYLAPALSGLAKRHELELPLRPSPSFIGFDRTEARRLRWHLHWLRSPAGAPGVGFLVCLCTIGHPACSGGRRVNLLEMVSSYVASRAQPICNACIADHLSLQPRQAASAVTRLSSTVTSLNRCRGRCFGCCTTRGVTLAAPI